MSLAMIAVTMLYNIFLIVKIRYDKELITKITLRPYYCALAYLITICTEGVLKCYFTLHNKVPQNNLNVWNNVDKDGLIATIRVFDSVNIVFFIYFVALDICLIFHMMHYMEDIALHHAFIYLDLAG